VGVYKPVASGCRTEGEMLVSDDGLALWQAAGKPGTLEQVCPQRFAAPLAPHLAAAEEGRRVDRALLRSGISYWREQSDILLVEGAGGLMSPLSDSDYNATLADEFGYPLVVIAPNRLGTINATLQTLIAAAHYRDGLPVAGIVLNDIFPAASDLSRLSNLAQLELHASVPVLATVKSQGETLSGDVNWFALANKAQSPAVGNERE